jgi:hypothetical protein
MIAAMQACPKATTAVTPIRIFFDRDFDVRGKIALRDFSDEHGYFDPGNPHDQH